MLNVYLPLAPTIKLDTDESGKIITEPMPGVSIEAATLGELIDVVMENYDCKITKNPDLDKYFIYYDEKAPDGVLVDIHINRRGETICPKQNLDFVLEKNDEIRFGAPAC